MVGILLTWQVVQHDHRYVRTQKFWNDRDIGIKL